MGSEGEEADVSTNPPGSHGQLYMSEGHISGGRKKMIIVPGLGAIPLDVVFLVSTFTSVFEKCDITPVLLCIREVNPPYVNIRGFRILWSGLVSEFNKARKVNRLDQN